MFRHNQCGSLSVEMALFGGMLSLFIIPVVDLGMVLSRSLKLDGALRAGVQYALKYPTDTAGIQGAVTGASGLSNVSASVSTFCECNGAALSCNGTCAGTLATYRTITASHSSALLLTYPGLANPFVINRSISVRTN